jgi:hypothetical protein
MNRHAATARPATYHDVLDAPEHMVAELIEGALHLHPRPAFPHAFAASSLGGELVSPFGKGRDATWTLISALGGDEEVRVPPFDAVAFPLSALWPD